MSFEAYRIAVKLSLAQNITAGLGLISRGLIGTGKDVDNLQAKLKGLKATTIAGAAVAGVGFAGLAALKGPYEEAKKLAQAKANFETLNLTAFENSQAYATAAATSHKVLGTTITSNVKMVHDLHTAFGDLHHALETAPMFAKMSIVAKVANGGQEVDGLMNAAAKALEHRGGKVINNQAEFYSEADMLTKVMLGTKMRVTAQDYLTASGTGKMAYQMFDKEYLYGQFAALMAINGGARSGTEAMTGFSSLIGGHMDQKGKGFLAELGMWQEGFSKKRLAIMNEAMKGLSAEDRALAVKSMGGQPVIAGGLRDADAELFAHRPDLFMQKMVPLVRKRFGFDLTDEQVALLISRNLNRSTGNELGTLVTMALKLEKDAAIFKKTMGIGQAYEHYLKSPEGAEEAADAAWKNLTTVIGTVYLPAITNGLLKFAGVLNDLGQWMDRNEGLVKGLTWAFIGLAGSLAIGGLLMAGASGFRLLGTALGFPALASAGGLGGIIGMVGKLGTAIAGLGIAGAVGYGIGTMVHKQIEGTDTSNWIGRQVARTLAFFTADDEAHMALYQEGKWGADPLGLTNQQDRVKPVATKPAPRFENPDYLDLRKGSPYLPPPNQMQTLQFKSIINLDGRRLGESVTEYQTREAARPFAGIAGFDGTMALQPTGLNITR